MNTNIAHTLYNDPQINEICKMMLQAYKDNLTTMNAVATGSLRDTAFYEIDADEDHFTLYFNLNGYWSYLELGSKPHFPPVKAIEDWINVKGIVPQARNGRVPTTRQLAYMICHSMQRGKTDIDGQKVAFLKRPAIRYMLDDNDALLVRLTDRVAEIYKEEIDRYLTSVTAPIYQQSAYIS